VSPADRTVTVTPAYNRHSWN